ncbi:CoA ester lyase [Pseudomonas marginalis]|uniref:CoA ester lyase n=1 Tax=Pseudomonas marginalis TaxID=298 RepID=A0A9X9BPL1_PSEMA|nr:CoA ester lyase [Pseudomonas marginalis]TWR56191.1 CoA ester lyase [Pseudomonas marginalis]SEB60923.1 citrate lyase subunit beta / citryl-CoA lyase [Pseudomonas marginalis]
MSETSTSRCALLRSLLFVPGDSERKLEKASSCNADALILDLEDSVASTRTSFARGLVLEYLRARPQRGRQQLWVRINPLDTSASLHDLIVADGAPDGLMLPKVNLPSAVQTLSNYLDVLEVRAGLEPGSIRIVPVATETPQALFTLGGYAGCSPRLSGMTWGAEDLASALGASSNRRVDGEYDTVYQLARAFCLAGAAAASVPAIDTIYANYSDSEGLADEARAARRAGFTGKLAIHPGQVAIINEAFSPSADEVQWSKKVLQAFEDNPGLGTVGIEGRMLDMPHLKQALRLLDLASRCAAMSPS